MDLSVVIVSWNVRERLRECLQSIAETPRDRPIAYEVFVVDNASSDGSAANVRAEFPWVRVIANAENRGFAAANNQAIRVASRSEFVLLLNPDMRVLPGTLEGIVAFMREPRNARVGVAGCHLIDGAGRTVPHVRRFPKLLDQLAILCKIPHVFPWVTSRYLMRDVDGTHEARVDSIRGSFFCIRRMLLESIGALDERFFVWFEEVDFCKRARDAGWEVAYTPTVQCVDHVGQSFNRLRLFPKQQLFTQSMLTYFRKHHPSWEWAILATVRPLVLAAAWMHDLRFILRADTKRPEGSHGVRHGDTTEPDTPRS